MRTRMLIVSSIALLSACAEVGLEPDVPAAIELNALPSPSVVIGDTLRDIAGKVTPMQAVVRNVAGAVIPDAAVRYLYADFQRDSALAVDSISGFVFATRAPSAGLETRLAARVSTSLQVLKSIIVTTRPDSADRIGEPTLAVFPTNLADTGRVGANANRSPALTMVVRHVEAPGNVTRVNGWLVRFVIVSPANPENDTTKAVYLVDDATRASVLDTTNSQGVAGRSVRIRAAQFPTAATPTDTVVVHAIVTYKGAALKGSPVRIALPVRRGT